MAENREGVGVDRLSSLGLVIVVASVTRDVTSCLVVSLAGRSACVTLDWLLRTGWLCVDC